MIEDLKFIFFILKSLTFKGAAEYGFIIKGRRDYLSRPNRDHPVRKILLTTSLFVTVISKTK